MNNEDDEIIMFDDEPPVTFESVMKYLGAFLAGVSFTAACIAAGLYTGI